MKLNGIEFEALEFTCPECGAVNSVDYTYKESNKSIQARCKCGKWIGNVKYDKRPKDLIRREKIREWKRRRDYLIDVCLTKEDAEADNCITMTFSEFTAYIDKIFGENRDLEFIYFKRHEETKEWKDI